MYDVLLLSIEQPNEIDEKLSYGNLTIETMNHFGDIREKYYFEKWPFFKVVFFTNISKMIHCFDC